MSAPDNSWEADIRYEVEQHEFDYDPQAWEAMDELLDQAGGSSSPPSNGKGPLFGPTSLWLLLLGLVMALLYSFWPTSTSPALSSFTIAPSVKEEIVEIIAPEPEMEPITTVQPQSVAEMIAPTEEENISQEEPTPPEEISAPLRPPVILIQPLPASNEIPLLKTPNLPTLFEWKPPLSTRRRRRDRKTLFPDIIPTY